MEDNAWQRRNLTTTALASRSMRWRPWPGSYSRRYRNSSRVRKGREISGNGKRYNKGKRANNRIRWAGGSISGPPERKLVIIFFAVAWPAQQLHIGKNRSSIFAPRLDAINRQFIHQEIFPIMHICICYLCWCLAWYSKLLYGVL